MTFHTYIKLCRKNLNFTQRELVAELYKFDTIFRGLDAGALGRWERAVTETPLLKKVKLLEYFFREFDFYFPFLNINDVESIEKKLLAEGVTKFLGKHKDIVMSFPTPQSEENDFTIKLAEKSNHKDTAFATATNICEAMYGEDTYYTAQTLHEYSSFPSSLFFICEYKGQYFGHSFFIYMKPEIYDKVMNFEMDYMDVTTEHLALENEKGSYMSMGLFAMNDKALALLFVRFYAYLIINQKNILKIGTLISDNDAINIARNFGLQKYAVQDDLMAYSAELKNVLLTEQIIKILFSPNNAPVS